MADLDSDGHADLITGTYEGLLYLVPGTKAGFDTPRPMRDRDGKLIHSGMYYDPETRKFVGLDGGNPHGYSGAPVDWDDDGDLDLVIGTSRGAMFVRINEGTKTEPAFATENVPVMAGRRQARIEPGQAMPVCADWDGDGRFDLVSGSANGGVFWLRNVGEEGEPKFERPRQLVASGKADHPARRTQVAVADFDADGDLDLLVGDYGKTGGKRSGHVWLVRRKGAPATVVSRK